MISIIVLLLLSLLAIALHLFDWPQPQMSSNILSPPSAQHWLGTDALGQDLLLRLIEALPNTLLLSFFCALLPLLIATLLASISVLVGKWLDKVLVKLIDILLLIPSLLPMMLLAALMEPNIWSLILIISLLSWPDDFKVLRAAIRRQLGSDAMHNARSLGASSPYLLSRYIWPALLPLLKALFVQNARQGIMLSAGMAFLGLTDPRMPGWGVLLFDAQQQLHTPAFWWLLPGPLLALTLFIQLLNSTTLHSSGKAK